MKVEYFATVESIVKSSGGSLLYGDPCKEIKAITTDSRDMGEDNLFVPIIGKRFNGHQFIDQLARDKSIVAFLTMKEKHRSIAEDYGVCAILCDDTLKAYGRIASRHREELGPIVIGITGTNGKTTTKELIWSVLNRRFKSLKNEKNYNNEIGVPYTLLKLKREHKFAVIEMGMNHIGEIDILSRLVMPDLALITNIGEGHLEFLGNIENVAHAKSEIIHGMKEGSLIFLNRDSQCFDILYDKSSRMKLNIKSFGLTKDADITPDRYEIFRDGIELQFNMDVYRVPIFGIHNVYNTLAALVVLQELRLEKEIIKEAFLQFSSVDMRSQVLDRGYIVIDDTYNSNPLSSYYAFISLIETYCDRRKIAVLSDMKELGSLSEFYHLEMGRLVYENGFDILCTWGEMAADIARGAIRAGMKDKSALSFNTKDELIEFLLKNLTKNDVILVKGSRSMKMEEVVDAIVH